MMIIDTKDIEKDLENTVKVFNNMTVQEIWTNSPESSMPIPTPRFTALKHKIDRLHRLLHQLHWYEIGGSK